MTLKIKKLIAREFIFFLCSLLITTVSYLSVNLYNHSQDKKLLKLASNIAYKSTIYDSLTKPYLEKVDNDAKVSEYITQVYAGLQDAYGKNGTVQKGALISSFDSFTKKLQDTSYTRTVYSNFENAYGKGNIIDFESFKIKVGKGNKIILTDNQIENYRISSKLNEEIQAQKKEKQETEKAINGKKNSTNVGQISFLFSILSFFVLRYLFYATKWSLKILKQE